MDINLKLETSGETPLHLLLARRAGPEPAREAKWWQAVRTLRRLGADIHARDSRGACGLCVLASCNPSVLLPELFSEGEGGFDRAGVARHVNVGPPFPPLS